MDFRLFLTVYINFTFKLYLTLLCDSGYALEPWTMTPYTKSIDGSAESRYNTAHAKARGSKIESVFGIVKGRWRCLLHTRELHYQPQKVAQIINVCCLLHNLCIKYLVLIDESEVVMDASADNQIAADELNNNLMQEAKSIRDNIRDNL